MAPKRSARPQQPPSPVASSEETDSGSGSEEEEEIAHSTPPAALKSIAPPPQKDQEPEASDEDEDGEEDDDEEEEDEKANHVIPSSATKNPPPLPPTREESETSDEEEEEEEADDEMPQTKRVRDQEAKGAKQPSAPFKRIWSTDDEVRILEFLAAQRLEHGTLPQADVLANGLAGKLDNSGCSLSELQGKVKGLRIQYAKAVKKGALPSRDRDRRLFDLCKNVWPSVTKAAATKVAANGGVGREPDELYPYLAEEVRALQKAHPGLFKREFAMMDDSKARALDEKVKKQRLSQMRLHLRGHDLTKEVAKALMDLAE